MQVELSPAYVTTAGGGVGEDVCLLVNQQYKSVFLESISHFIILFILQKLDMTIVIHSVHLCKYLIFNWNIRAQTVQNLFHK